MRYKKIFWCSMSHLRSNDGMDRIFERKLYSCFSNTSLFSSINDNVFTFGSYNSDYEEIEIYGKIYIALCYSR